jgi:lipooligosaccharide transport system permease protein
MWGATKGIIYGTTITIVISAFGLVDSPMIALMVPFLFLGALIFAEVAVISVALAPGIDTFNYYYTLFMTPMFLFSGIFFPIDTLPPVVAKIAYFTPLYHLVNVSRSFAGGGVPLGDIVWLAAAAAVISPLPFRLMRRRILRG